MKILSVILLCVLLFSFASCSQDPQNTIETSNETRIIEETTDTPSEFQTLDVNYEGYQFRIYAIHPDVLLLDSAVGLINEIAPEAETGEPINDAVYRRNRKVEELYNIEIVSTFHNSRDAVVQAARKAILAAEDAYDVGFTVGITMPTILASKDYTYDLFTIPNLDLTRSWWNKKAIAEFSIANQLHITTGDISIFDAMSIDCFYRNKFLADDYGLESAYELVYQGNWTWDKLIEMCHVVARDLNGDGVMNEWDQYGMYTEFAAIRYMFRSCGGRIVKKDADDIPYLAVNTDITVKVIDYALASFMNKDIAMVSQDYKFNNYYADSMIPKYIANEVLFALGAIYTALDLRNMECDFEILPYPKLNEQQSEYYAMTSRSYGTHIHIPATCTDTGRVGAVLDALGYYSQQYIKPAVFDITVTDKLMRDEDSVRMVDLMLDTREYDIGEYYNWGDLINVLLYSSLSARQNIFASNYAKNEDRIKSAMEKTISDMLE
ncbi:MAG: extracellular solute-binding protein [Oscillospiraceae bacterium]|nr:extracellular solute-binding protein [Oscillospiraceae bacterium]